MIIKICGIRTLEAAQTATRAGATMLGFIFVKESKRYIQPENARTIINKLSNIPAIVGIFKNHNPEQVNTISKFLTLDYVQLHGNESPEFIRTLSKPVIKAVLSTEDLSKYAVEYFLLDRPQQGSGDMVNRAFAAQLATQYPLIYAGGLTPGNVSDIIRAVRPLGVDVAGGVETNGAQDIAKIRSFITNAQTAF